MMCFCCWYPKGRILSSVQDKLQGHVCDEYQGAGPVQHIVAEVRTARLTRLWRRWLDSWDTTILSKRQAQKNLKQPCIQIMTEKVSHYSWIKGLEGQRIRE